MHPEAKIFETKFRKVVAIDRVRIKVVFLQPATEAPALLVFAPEKTDREKERGGDDRSDDVDRQIAAKPAKD